MEKKINKQTNKQTKYAKKLDTFNLIQFSVHQNIGKRESLSS